MLNPRVWTLFFLGLAGSVGISLFGSTLTVRLVELGLTKTALGYLGILHLPYSIRLLWGPVTDYYRLPWLFRAGKRKSWCLFALSFHAVFVALAGILHPVEQFWLFAPTLMAVFLSAGCVYMTGLSYEMESLQEGEYALGSAFVNAGYRMGLLLGGAGALFAAAIWEWQTAYLLGAGTILVGAVAVLIRPEPLYSGNHVSNPVSFLDLLYKGVLTPIRSFFEQKNWMLLLACVLLYRIGDDLAGGYLTPYFIETGFSKLDIAWTVKLFGMAATFAGVLIGGFLAKRVGLMPALLLFGALHASAYFPYIFLQSFGANLTWLAGMVAWEHFTGGLVITVFIAFLWKIAQKDYAAMQYALLWSLLSAKHTLLYFFGGILADYLGWTVFLSLATLCFLPGLCLLYTQGVSKVGILTKPTPGI